LVRTNPVIACSVVAAGLAFAIVHGRADAQESTQDLAAAAQNPVAAMYSLPFYLRSRQGLADRLRSDLR
jgi:hypothetical protein